MRSSIARRRGIAACRVQRPIRLRRQNSSEMLWNTRAGARDSIALRIAAPSGNSTVSTPEPCSTARGNAGCWALRRRHSKAVRRPARAAAIQLLASRRCRLDDWAGVSVMPFWRTQTEGMDVPQHYWCAKLVNYAFPNDVEASFVDADKPSGIHGKMMPAVRRVSRVDRLR